ncbi:MAG: hypothetical protein ACQES8_06185 [Thermodesulfobacteriota bacterium]
MFQERKTRVDEARTIDILDLQREGIFKTGTAGRWSVSWSRNGRVVASISYQLETGNNGPLGLRFIYTITDRQTGAKRDYNYIIPVTSTPCNYGGRRWWFVCPLIVNGRSCRRRCRIVYQPPGAGYFGCRECHELTYESRQRHREKFYEGFQKPYKVAQAAQEELARTRSWAKKEKIWIKLIRAQAVLDNYEKSLTGRSPKITYKEE